MRRVPFSAFQYIASSDLNNIGIFNQQGLDALTADAVGTGKFWVNMAVTAASTSIAAVAVGRIYIDGVFYGTPDLDEASINLAVNIPTGAKRIVAIVGFGSEDGTALEPRFFENQVTGLKEPQNVATEIRRKVTVDKVVGAESSSPQRPAIDPNYVPIAWVTLGTGGIEAIEMAVEYRLPSLELIDGRVVSLEEFRITAGNQLETLRTDMAVTNQKVSKINAPLLNQTARRIASIEDKLGIDESASLWGFDRFMTDDDSDLTGVGYKARVEEGLRFPWAATATAVLALLNPAEPRIKTASGWTLPAYTSKKRLDIWGQYISVNLSNYQYANTSFTIFPGAERRRRYGPSQIVSQNSDFWASVEYSVNYLTETFKKDGVTYNITDQWIEDGVTFYRVQQYFDDKVKYWNGYQGITPTVENGYLLAQTFLNAQAGWLTQIGLRFQKVDAAHGVKVYVVLAPKGVPDPEQVVATGAITAGTAVASGVGDGVENLVTISPVYLDPGQRYATILVSGGDYAVACRDDNALSNGTLFFGDGNTFVADIGKDMNLRLYFAEFTTPYVTVDLATQTLGGGITDIDLLSLEQVPDGTAIDVQVQKDGVWFTLDKVAGTHPLASKPTTLPMRLVFIGTTDVMPGIKLGQSKVTLNRADDDFVHWSEIRDAGTGVTAIDVELNLVNWDGAKHTLAATIEHAGGPDTPDTTVDIAQADGSILRRYTFSPTSTSTYQIKLVGTTTDVVDTFVVAERYDVTN